MLNYEEGSLTQILDKSKKYKLIIVKKRRQKKTIKCHVIKSGFEFFNFIDLTDISQLISLPLDRKRAENKQINNFVLII